MILAYPCTVGASPVEVDEIAALRVDHGDRAEGRELQNGDLVVRSSDGNKL